MIKQIQINNFQSHQDTRLSLDPGVNVIVGSSDSGKSAIIRALRWIIQNKVPANFRSTWGGDTQIVLSSDNIITRSRTNKDNAYSLEGQEYKSFNKDIPEEVERTLNFSDINTQFQMDSPFLLSKSAGEVARTLNKIVNLDAIDYCLTNVERQKRKIKTDTEYSEENLKTHESNMLEFSGLDEMEKNIERIECRIKKRDKLSNDLISFKSMMENYQEIITELKEIPDYTKASITIKELEKIIEEQNILYKNKTDFTSLIATHQTATEELEEIIERTPTTIIGVIIEELEKDCERKKQELADYEKGKMIVEEAVSVSKELHDIVSQLDGMEKEYEKLMPKVCPLCEQEIK